MEKKRKIVICTLYKSINCGTFLQAYSLHIILKKLGFDVFFLDLNSSLKSSVHKRIKIKYTDKMIVKLINKINLKIIFKKYQHQFRQITIDEFNNDSSINNVIVGSDEIWNLKNNSFIHFKEYFGYNFKNKRVIAYAPSANDTTKEDVLNYYNGDNVFENFCSLSSRDIKTKLLMQSFGFKDIVDVLDPTMLLDSFDEIIEHTSLENYVVIYGHEFSDDQVFEIIRFAKHKNLKMVSFTKYFKWCDKNIAASPGQFISYIKNANYVITSTFHGSVFSILLKKQFVVYLNNGSKINDLLEKFELTNRIINDKTIEETIDSFIDFKSVFCRIEELKYSSINYLQKSIKEE